MFYGKHIITTYMSHVLNYRFNSEKCYLTKYQVKMCYYSLLKKIKSTEGTYHFQRVL